jgi:hypothetical protein
MIPIPGPAGEPVAAGAGRIFAGPESLAGVVRAAFGPGRRLAAVHRLRGGSKKGVCRSRAAYPADIALVEDVRGESLETRLERCLPGRRRPARNRAGRHRLLPVL